MNQPIQETALDVLRAHAKSFRWASFFLSKRERVDAAVAYAFCRYVDDLVDEANDPEKAGEELERLKSMLLGQDEPNDLVAAYREVANRTGFGLAPALDLLHGARSDLRVVRVADSSELETYCYRVAGTVGLMMCGILGVTDRRALSHAMDLGGAMQLTNICRDVLEDALNDRVYLPQSLLRRAGSSQEALLQLARAAPSEAVDAPARRAASEVISELLARADDKYERAKGGYPYLPPRSRLSIMVAAEIYRQIGVTLQSKNDCDPLLGRVTVRSSRKMSLTAKAVFAWAGASSGAA